MKKKAYTPSKSTGEKADTLLRQIKIENALTDLARGNKKTGIITKKKNNISEKG